MLGGIFGKIFGPEKGKNPNFGLAELHFWAPSCVYGCRVWAETAVKLNLMFVSTVKHQNRLNALLYLDKVGNMIQKVFAAIPIDLFCPL